MARQFQLEILSLNERIFSGAISSLVMPAEEGYWGVLAGHMPSIAKLKEGKVRARINGEEKEWIIKGGYAWVEREKTVLLVELGG